MAKSKLPKWFNPTGDDYWDGYYTLVTPVFIALVGLVLLILGAATYNTFFK